MKMIITLGSDQLDKEDLRKLLQALRLCEMANFPNKEIYIKVEVPELATNDLTEIVKSIKPPYKWGPKVYLYGEKERR